MNRRRAVFLDLNGTLVTPVVVNRLSELRPVSGAAEAVARLSRAGYLCPVVTVQSRIEKGLFSSVEFNSWFGEFAANMAAQGADIQGPYICPHRFANPCACAKPQTLLYEQAAQELKISLPDSFTIGDTAADIEAAQRFGGRGCLVLTGYAGQDASARFRAQQVANFTAPNLHEAVDWILRSAAS